MNGRKFLGICLLIAGGLTSCAPPGPFPPPIPSPAGDWTLVLVQSGGFAGVNLQVNASSDGALVAMDARRGHQASRSLSSTELRELDELLTGLRLRLSGNRPSACADCFLYDLEITYRGQRSSWRGDDTTLEASGAADLIRLLGRLRDEALAGAS